MPTTERISAHRDVLAALGCLRAMYQGLLMPRPPASVRTEKEQAVDLLAELPEPYRTEALPMLKDLRQLHVADPPERTRRSILELSNDLLAFARRLMG